MGFHAASLFATPTALSGAARVLDLGGVFDSYNDYDSPEEADRTALALDWWAVGDAIRAAMDEVASPR